MYPDQDEDQTEDMRLNGKIECHQRMVFEDNTRGVDYEKYIIHANRRDAYKKDKKC